MPMSSIITNVILPGLGPVCPECFSRGHIPAFSLAPGEVYSCGIAEPQAQLDWDVDAARALTHQRVEWMGDNQRTRRRPARPRIMC
jgi:hypothetical protein